MKHSIYFIDHRGAHIRLTRWRRLRAQWRRRDIGLMPLCMLVLAALSVLAIFSAYLKGEF